MRKGQKSGRTHAQEDLAEHREIKPRAHEPRAPLPNDAHKRLQLSPSDPRWDMVPPYGWVKKDPGDSYSRGLTFAKCWYCASTIRLDEPHLYSAKLSMCAHTECFGDGDTISPKRATLDST